MSDFNRTYREALIDFYTQPWFCTRAQESDENTTKAINIFISNNLLRYIILFSRGSSKYRI